MHSEGRGLRPSWPLKTLSVRSEVPIDLAPRLLPVLIGEAPGNQHSSWQPIFPLRIGTGFRTR